MGTEAAFAASNLGTQYSLHQRFGRFLVGPLLRGIANDLPRGARVRLITIIDPHVRDLLKSRGLAVWRFPWRHDADLELGGGAEHLDRLAAVAEEHQTERLAVGLLAYDEAGNRLLEAEDANDFLWLADSLPQVVRERLVAAVGGSVSQLDHVR